MELYLGQVPDDVVWAVHVADEWGSKHVWFLTADASSQTYRDEERYLDFGDSDSPVTLTRWEIKLPKRGMEADDVDVFVEEALRVGMSATDHGLEFHTCRRLDIHATKIKT